MRMCCRWDLLRRIHPGMNAIIKLSVSSVFQMSVILNARSKIYHLIHSTRRNTALKFFVLLCNVQCHYYSYWSQNNNIYSNASVTQKHYVNEWPPHYCEKTSHKDTLFIIRSYNVGFWNTCTSIHRGSISTTPKQFGSYKKTFVSDALYSNAFNNSVP